MKSSTVLRILGLSRVALGLWLALDPRPDSSLLPIGVAADAVDAAAALLVRKRIPRKNFRGAVTGAVLFAGVGAVLMLRDPDWPAMP